MRHSMSKDTAFNGETTPRHTFLLATRNVCPLAIPESCAQNMGIRLLENHSWVFIGQIFISVATVTGRLTERERAGRREPWERGWQILSLSKKTKWRTKLPEGFACPIPPFNGADFCGEGTGYSRSSGEQI